MSWNLEPFVSCWKNLFSQWYDGLPEISDLGNASCENSRTLWNFKAEVCAKSAVLHLTMHWITEVETAKSTDDLTTSQSITGRRDFPDYEMLDAKIASALTKLLTSVYFRKRVSAGEQRAQKDDRFLRGKQIAYIIHEYFRATGACQAVQGLSGPFNLRLQNDDVQDFDTAASEIPTEINGSGGFIPVKKCRILFSFRLYWLWLKKRILETTNKRAISV